MCRRKTGRRRRTASPAGKPTAAIARRRVSDFPTIYNGSSICETVQDWVIRPQMRTVPGVAGADAIGGYVKQYRIEPDPARLVGYGLSFGKIADAIDANNASRGANYIEHNGEGYVVRATGRVEHLDEIGNIVIATRAGIPVRVKDVARVTTGRELRTGSASVNGREVVLGTALMLVGGNSRTVAAAADAKIKEINLTLPAGVRARTVLNRTDLVDATVRTVATNLAIGALLVVLVLFLMLGNFRTALITALVIPITMLITSMGMLEGKISANLMSLGALDFGLIVDGAIIIAENSLRHLAERRRRRTLGRTLTPNERRETVAASSREVIQPTVYGQAVIVLVYVPLLGFSGVEGKTFLPMALTVIIALATAFVLLADLCNAGHAGDGTRRQCPGAREPLGERSQDDLPACLDEDRPKALADHWNERRDGGRGGAPVHAARPGVRAHIGREEHRHGGQAHSQHLADAIAGDAVRQ